VPYSVITTGAATQATVSVSVDAGASVPVAEIAAGAAGWTIAGRTKTAEGEFAGTLAAGVHELAVCVEQRGTDGRLPRRACAAIALVISCS
jgi:hypothetical protein